MLDRIPKWIIGYTAPPPAPVSPHCRVCGRTAGLLEEAAEPRGSRSYPLAAGRVLLGSAGWRCCRSIWVPYRYVPPSCHARLCERDGASAASPKWNPASTAAVVQPTEAAPSAGQLPGVVDPCCTALGPGPRGLEPADPSRFHPKEWLG